MKTFAVQVTFYCTFKGLYGHVDKIKAASIEDARVAARANWPEALKVRVMGEVAQW